MKDTSHPTTAEELYSMSADGIRRELVLGEVREMPPAGGEHGFITGNISFFLQRFVRENRLGYVFAAETGFTIARNPDTVRAPDCAFVRAERIPGPVPSRFLQIPPDLAVETISPDDRPGEMEEKVGQWLASGVRLVWMVDPRRKIVTIHRPGCKAEAIDNTGTLDGEDVLPGLHIPVAEVWV